MADLDWLFNAGVMRLLANGLLTTVLLAIVCGVLSFIVGNLLALARMSRLAAIRYPAIVYIEIVRALPLLLLVFAVYFLAQPLFGLGFVVGGESRTDGALEVACAGVLVIDLLEEQERFFRFADAEITSRHGLAHGEIVGEGLKSRCENSAGAGGVAVLEGGCGALHAPVGPEPLDGFALGVGKVLTRAKTH